MSTALKVLNLMPGDYYFGNDTPMLKTLLGSCVAVTLWHPQRKVGGMCHIVIPGGQFTGPDCNTRQAGCAIGKFVNDIEAHGMHPSEFIVGIYGGGRMFSTRTNQVEDHVGARNIADTYRMVVDAGFRISDQDVLENKYRHVLLDINTGRVEITAMEVESTMD